MGTRELILFFVSEFAELHELRELTGCNECTNQRHPHPQPQLLFKVLDTNYNIVLDTNYSTRY